MENSHRALKEAFNKEIVTLLRFLLEGTDLHNQASELDFPISLDEIAGNSHWLKGRRSGKASEGSCPGELAQEDSAARP